MAGGAAAGREGAEGTTATLATTEGVCTTHSSRMQSKRREHSYGLKSKCCRLGGMWLLPATAPPHADSDTATRAAAAACCHWDRRWHQFAAAVSGSSRGRGQVVWEGQCAFYKVHNAHVFCVISMHSCLWPAHAAVARAHSVHASAEASSGASASESAVTEGSGGGQGVSATAEASTRRRARCCCCCCCRSLLAREERVWSSG